MIQVLVGKDGKETKFHVHQNLLINRSAFFKNALSNGWKEAEDRLVKLPEDKPETFKIYIHFTYTGHLAVIAEPDPKGRDRSKEHPLLADLYVLAEKLQDINCKNAIMRAMFHTCRPKGVQGNTPSAKICCIIYEGTPEGSPMRKLLVDLYTYIATKAWIMSASKGKWPEDFMYELLINVLDKRAPVPDTIRTSGVSKYLELLQEPI